MADIERAKTAWRCAHGARHRDLVPVIRPRDLRLTARPRGDDSGSGGEHCDRAELDAGARKTAGAWVWSDYTAASSATSSRPPSFTIRNVHGFIGGLHLTGGLFEPIMPATIDDLVSISPDMIVPGHCTGWKATHAVAAALQEAYAASNVGTTFRFVAG